MSSVETGRMSAVETGQKTAAETSFLSQQKTYVPSQQEIFRVSDTCSGQDTSRSPYFGNRKVTFQTDGTPKSRIAVRFQWAQSCGELLKNQKNKMARCHCVSCRARPQISKNGRKWPQNGRLELRIEPRASNRA